MDQIEPCEPCEPCELCQFPGGEILWQDDLCRVVRVGGDEGRDYPGYCRVIWRAHVSEMSDLPDADRAHLQALVYATETVLRACYRPHKINLASLGNIVPHLHWHVIPRFSDDRHFPAPIWAKPRRAASPSRAEVSSAVLRQAITQALAGKQGSS